MAVIYSLKDTAVLVMRSFRDTIAIAIEDLQSSILSLVRSGHRRCSVRKRVLRNFAKFTGKHLCQSLFLNKNAENFIKKETLAKAFPCEYCEVAKKAFLQRTPPVAASD